MTWPNLLSALRIALIPIFITSVLEQRAWPAFLVFTLAGITDLLDGLIARFFQQQSALGAYLDPMADKLLLTAAFIMLAIPGLYPGLQIPVWITGLVITRDVIIVVVAAIVYLHYGITRFPPSIISKWNTAFQIIAIFAVLLTGLSSSFDLLAKISIWTMVALTTASGLEYGNRFIYRFNELTELAAQQREERAARRREEKVQEEKAGEA